MTRARRDAERLQMVAGAVEVVWGFRLELALAVVVVLARAYLARVVGGLGAWVLVAAVAAVVLAVTVSRRWLGRGVLAARVRRRWRRAWKDCGLARVWAGRVTRVPAGELVRVRASRGSSLEEVAARAEELAVCLGLREVRVVRDRHNAATGTVTLVRRDALADLGAWPWPHVEAERLSLWDAVPVGADELGQTVSIRLPERNVLLGGEPGAGKSVALSLLVASAALDPSARVWLLDGKLVELSAWAPCAERLAGPDIDDAIDLLRDVRGVMEERYRALLANGARKITPGDGLALHLVACDELAFYLTCEDRKQRVLFAELLRDLVARGRAAGVIVCAATQKPAADVVPSALRDLFGFRLALRCNTRDASDTILGQGWATLGYSAASIAPGERGIGLLLAEDGIPLRLRAFHLADEDVAAISQRAAAARAEQEWQAQASSTAGGEP